jgi:hypothetical protein
LAQHKRKLRRQGRKAKPGTRAPSGRLSEAAAAIPVDPGSRYAERHRLLLCNGADPVLAASALGILLANRHISRDQVRAGERYAAARAILFGLARPVVVADHLEPYDPPVRSDGHLARIRKRFEGMIARLGPDQKRALDAIVIDGKLPPWFRLVKAGLPLRPVDEAERVALIGGLDRLVGPESR